ncbi:hypothetical protein MKW98_027851 [Papaver atlanticum]|uniref:Uncharacterized protein n=1 Tax=Papaver atlanticum TaxID=357466 RepID=A0AAD4XGJ5_9MAGN|nr:hypothetical protein MKW98_027851 [Papaver atlanticum]
MSTYHGQVHPDQQDTVSKDQCQTQPEQQESTTITERKDINWIKVAKLSAYGILEYHLIPTRSCWLESLCGDWGTTDDEIKVCIEAQPAEQFIIEVCGRHMGYGVIIVRDGMRNPIVVISRVADGYVSSFYHELQGVSLGLKLAMKYKNFDFDFNCVSGAIYGYVMRTWKWKYDCDCPPRDNPGNPREKKHYCVECSASILDEFGERMNADKILPLIDEIFYDALEFAREAVWHLANSGMDQELRLHEIEEDEELAEIVYKEVFNHGSEQEIMSLQQQRMLVKEQLGAAESDYKQ